MYNYHTPDNLKLHFYLLLFVVYIAVSPHPSLSYSKKKNISQSILYQYSLLFYLGHRISKCMIVHKF